MALALNNLKRVDMPLNKETEPNQELQTSKYKNVAKHLTHSRIIKYE